MEKLLHTWSTCSPRKRFRLSSSSRMYLLTILLHIWIVKIVIRFLVWRWRRRRVVRLKNASKVSLPICCFLLFLKNFMILRRISINTNRMKINYRQFWVISATIFKTPSLSQLFRWTTNSSSSEMRRFGRQVTPSSKRVKITSTMNLVKRWPIQKQWTMLIRHNLKTPKMPK